MQEYFWVSAILFVAALLTGCTGFGTVLLSMPLLTILLDVQTAVVVASLATCLISLLLLINLRRDIDSRKVGPLFLGALPGVPIGVYLLGNLDKMFICIALGAILVIYPVLMVALNIPVRKSGIIETCCFGFFAGCLGGAFGTSGPPVIIHTSMQPWPKNQTKATLLCFFLLQTLAAVIAYVLMGIITPAALRYFEISLPPILLGTVLGANMYGSVKDEAYRRMVLILMPLLGLLMIWHALAS